MLRIFFLTNISPERNINVAVIIFFFYKTCMKKSPKMLVLYRFYDFPFCNICP